MHGLCREDGKITSQTSFFTWKLSSETDHGDPRLKDLRQKLLGVEEICGADGGGRSGRWLCFACFVPWIS